MIFFRASAAFSLGLERTGGFETVAFCEIEDYPRRVLAKHWPGVPIYDDVRTLTADTLARDGIGVDVICGGFPCQDISTAGKGAGLAGERSGLWREYARLVGELRPNFVIVENVAALLGRGLGTVLGDLAEIGYDAEWHCIPAAAVGAPHRRDRLWIVAYPDCRWRRADAARRHNANRQNAGWTKTNGVLGEIRKASGTLDVANADTGYGQRRGSIVQMGWGGFASQIIKNGDTGRIEWSAEPNVGRVAHGVSNRVDRLGGLGNAVVPQIPELIGQAILSNLKLTAVIPVNAAETQPETAP